MRDIRCVVIATCLCVASPSALAESRAPAADVGEPTPVISPGEDWCAAANAGAPIKLTAGTFAGPCVIDTATAHVSALNNADPPLIAYDGNSSNVIDVMADNVTLRGLAFGPTQDGVDAIKIKSGNNTRVESCTFTGVAGISISANSANSSGVTIIGNHFKDLKATAIYLGCHEGQAECRATAVQVRDNLIDGVVSSGVGYGVQLKLDSNGFITDNVVHNTQGPGIMVYGDTGPAATIEVVGNYVVGSTQAAGIEVGGGTAFVANNIVIGGPEGGIYSYDYQDRGLIRQIRVLGNTVIGDGGMAMRLDDWKSGNELEVAGNAVWQMVGDTDPFPHMGSDGVSTKNNQGCGNPDLCWANAIKRDFWPVEDSKLTEDSGVTLTTDWCGAPRETPITFGALQLTEAESPGPLPIDFKAACPQPAPPDPPDNSGRLDPETGAVITSDVGVSPLADDEQPPPSRAERPDSGGCTHTGAPSPGSAAMLLLLLLSLALRWTSARPQPRSAATE